MIRTILVPLDGSPMAEQALAPACRLAHQTGAGLVLLRAAPFGADSAASMSPPRVTKQVAQDYLATIQHRLRDEGIPVQTEALHTDPVGAIAYAARFHGADLIMMTTHGRTGFGKLMLGSVADQLLHETTVPLLLIRVTHEQAAGAVAPFKRILVPLDGSKFSETALAFVTREGLADGNYATLLYVVAPAYVPFTDGGLNYTPAVEIEVGRMEVEQRLVEARRYLSAVADKYLPGTMPHFQVVVEHAAKAIVEIADVQSIDLIAMATHTHRRCRCCCSMV